MRIRVVQPFIADEGTIDSGQELDVSEARAIELESIGVAVRLDAPAPLAPGSGALETKPEPQTKLETKPEPAPRTKTKPAK